ncbi:MAG: methyltransferase family protein [Acidobacteriaceae bacterium]
MSATWAATARRIRVSMGFLFAAFFLWRAHPSAASLAWSLLLTIPGVLLRAWASGFVKKNAELAVTGPYAYTRNPLYLGSMLIAFGFAAASRNLWIALLLAVLFLVIYVPVIRSEEEFLRGSFPDFAAYCARVPRLLPRPTPARFPASTAGFSFSPALYRQHREYNAALGTCAIYAALLIEFYLRHRA